MFGVGRDVMLIGLQTMEAEKLTHYEVHCPKCRRANRVERKKLELANPNWRETLKNMAKEAAKAEKVEATTANEKKEPAKAKTTPKAKASKAKKSTAIESSAKKSTAKPAANTEKSTSKSSSKGKAKAK